MSNSNLICPKCQSDNCTNHGSVRGDKRFLCRSCGFAFVGSTDLTKPIKGAKSQGIKTAVMKLYLKGNSYRDIEDITSTLGETVSRTTVMNWVKKRANN
jgi:transposase-like protein